MMLSKENSWANENLSQESSDLMSKIKNKQSLEVNRQCFFYYLFSSQVIPRKAEEHLKGMELQ